MSWPAELIGQRQLRARRRNQHQPDPSSIAMASCIRCRVFRPLYDIVDVVDFINASPQSNGKAGSPITSREWTSSSSTKFGYIPFARSSGQVPVPASLANFCEHPRSSSPPRLCLQEIAKMLGDPRMTTGACSIASRITDDFIETGDDR